jgi:hypothetical protein
VRKTSQAALLALLEQELIERFDVETKVCPVLIDLTAPDSNDDVKTEAVAVSLLPTFQGALRVCWCVVSLPSLVPELRQGDRKVLNEPDWTRSISSLYL